MIKPPTFGNEVAAQVEELIGEDFPSARITVDPELQAWVADRDSGSSLGEVAHWTGRFQHIVRANGSAVGFAFTSVHDDHVRVCSVDITPFAHDVELAVGRVLLEEDGREARLVTVPEVAVEALWLIRTRGDRVRLLRGPPGFPPETTPGEFLIALHKLRSELGMRVVEPLGLDCKPTDFVSAGTLVREALDAPSFVLRRYVPTAIERYQLQRGPSDLR